ncbi:hypothetical protein N478_24890 [Pseudoalteromonas luteoviolacea S4060-1]|uniref:Uncharacterized protein n=1 Tax=Pseudoalteromonas luteoviolacea S4060-1 TaxID=1365257 RepID=A0A161YMN9_9GAMM|nr:hypothetical protein N478_24890 [Pseudoalteromonas luteoviolacea S4060-1]
MIGFLIQTSTICFYLTMQNNDVLNSEYCKNNHAKVFFQPIIYECPSNIPKKHIDIKKQLFNPIKTSKSDD